MAERVLYPCYFDAARTRKAGRRVAKDKAVEKPTSARLAAAAVKAGFAPVEEAKHCPGSCYAREGRIRVECTGSKEELIARIAEKL